MTFSDERSNSKSDFMNKSLFFKYVTRDCKHLKYATYKISYSGAGQYTGTILLSFYKEEYEKYIYVNVVSDSTRSSITDAVTFCEEMKAKIIEKLKYDNENNNTIYDNDIFKLRDDMKEFCKFKTRKDKYESH